METLKLTGKHIFLLLIYSPGLSQNINEPILGKTRIVKGMFLFDKEIKKDFLKNSNLEIIKFPEFYSWKFGPFAKEIYDDIEFFINNGFLVEDYLDYEKNDVEVIEEKEYEEEFSLTNEFDESQIVKVESQYFLTKKGRDFIAEKYFSKLSDNQKSILKKFKASINKATIPAIIRYTYVKYPDFTEHSIIRERILGY